MPQFHSATTVRALQIKYSRTERRDFFAEHVVTCVCVRVYTKGSAVVKLRNIVYMTHSTARKDDIRVIEKYILYLPAVQIILNRD
jgi:hypothetical protein